jgi:invasion protein IalB
MLTNRLPAPRLGRSVALAALVIAALCLGPAPLLAQQQQQQPKPETQQFQDWTVVCFDVQGQKRCRMLQNVGNGEGSTIMQASVILLQNDQAGLIFRVPLGTWLPEGFRFRVDSGEEIQVPFVRCLPPPDNCVVEVGLNQQVLDQLKAGTQVNVRFFDPQRRQVEASVSLLGFTAAFAALNQ